MSKIKDKMLDDELHFDDSEYFEGKKDTIVDTLDGLTKVLGERIGLVNDIKKDLERLVALYKIKEIDYE